MILQIFPNEIVGIFTSDKELLRLSVIALRKATLGVPFASILIVTSTVYQSLGRALPALVLSMSRQFFFLVPFMLILPIFFRLNGLWYSIPSSDLCSSILALFLLISELKRIRELKILG
jgi:Na+-driven multidrug efflux pump